MIMREEDIDLERAAHDATYRRKVIATLNRQTAEPAAAADAPEKTSDPAAE